MPGNFWIGDYEKDFRPPKALSILYMYFIELNKELIKVDNQNFKTRALLSPHIDPKKNKEVKETNKWKFDGEEWQKTWRDIGLLDYSQKFIL